MNSKILIFNDFNFYAKLLFLWKIVFGSSSTTCSTITTRKALMPTNLRLLDAYNDSVLQNSKVAQLFLNKQRQCAQLEQLLSQTSQEKDSSSISIILPNTTLAKNEQIPTPRFCHIGNEGDSTNQNHLRDG